MFYTAAVAPDARARAAQSVHALGYVPRGLNMYNTDEYLVQTHSQRQVRGLEGR